MALLWTYRSHLISEIRSAFVLDASPGRAADPLLLGGSDMLFTLFLPLLYRTDPVFSSGILYETDKKNLGDVQIIVLFHKKNQIFA